MAPSDPKLASPRAHRLPIGRPATPSRALDPLPQAPPDGGPNGLYRRGREMTQAVHLERPLIPRTPAGVLPHRPGALPLALPMFLTNPDVPSESYTPGP